MGHFIICMTQSMSVLVKCEIMFHSLHYHNLGNEHTINLTFFDEENDCLCMLRHATNYFFSEVAPNVCKWVQVVVLTGINALEYEGVESSELIWCIFFFTQISQQ